MVSVGIVGGSGYMGGEALRVLLRHPQADIAWVTSRVSGSSETKTYGKSTLVREHEEQPTRPRRSLFGKDSDERARIFNALHMLFSSPEGLFSGKLSGTAIAGRW